MLKECSLASVSLAESIKRNLVANRIHLESWNLNVSHFFPRLTLLSVKQLHYPLVKSSVCS